MDGVWIASSILAAVSVLSVAWFFCLFLRVKALQQGPGQFFMCQCVAQLIWDLHWYQVFFANQYHTTCRVLGGVVLCAYMCAFNYTLATCLFTSRLFNEKKNISKKVIFIFHATVVLSSMTFAAIIGYLGGTGPSYYEYLCFTYDYTEYRVIQLVVVCVYTPTCLLITLLLSIKRRNEEHFSAYMIIIIVVYSLCLLPQALLSYFDFGDIKGSRWSLFYITAIASPMSGLLTVLIRVSDKTVWQAVQHAERLRGDEQDSLEGIS